jgi:hypothetical protein
MFAMCWDAVNESIVDEAIAPVRWICESCIVVGIEDEAVTQRNEENVCQDCAEEIESREAEGSARGPTQGRACGLGGL